MARAFETTQFADYYEKIKSAIMEDAIFENNDEIKELRRGINSSVWKERNKKGLTRTNLRNITEKILRIEEVIGKEI